MRIDDEQLRGATDMFDGAEEGRRKMEAAKRRLEREETNRQMSILYEELLEEDEAERQG
jgi:hypothetical protein